MASLLSWLGNAAAGVERRLNPFDNGATYSNPHPQGGLQVRNQPQQSQQQQRPLSVAQPQGQRGLQLAGSTPQQRLQATVAQQQPLHIGGLSIMPSPNMRTQAPTPPPVNNPNPQPAGGQNRSVISKVWDQVNPLDNGRTFQQAQPAQNHQGSIIHQATHNGVTNAAGDVIHSVTNVAAAPINMGRGMVDQFVTGNQPAAQRAYNLALQDARNNLVTGLGKQIAGTGQALNDVIVKQGAALLTGNQKASDNANAAAVTDFNKTPFGQVLDPLQHKLAEYQVHRDLGNLSPQQQKQAIAQNEAKVGLDPNASLGKQALTSGLAAGQLIVPEKLVNGVPIAEDLAAKGAKVADTAQAAKAALQDHTVPLNQVGAVGKDVNNAADNTKVPQEPTPKQPPTPNIVTPSSAGAVKQSKFTKTAINSPEVSPATAAAIKADPANYITTSNAEHLQGSQDFLQGKSLGNAHQAIMDRLSVPTGKIDHQTVSDAIATAKALDARGKGADLQGATDIYNNLAEHLSKQGQSIQAASLLNNRTPEGLQFGALRALKKGGVNISPDVQATVKGMAGEIRGATGDARQLAVAKLVHYVNNKLPRSKMEAGVGIWRAGLLTGPETATKVAFSHAITLPFESAAQIPTAIADRALSLFTGERSTSATLRGTGGGIVQGAKDFGYKMKTGIDKPGSGGEIPDFGSRTHQTSYEQFVGNLHGGLFKPAYEGRYMQSLNDQALTAARNQGLKGAEKEAFIKDFVSKPSDQARETANFDAARATNQQETDLGKMAQSLSHLTMGGFPIGKILAPFTRIPSAIGTVGMVDYTPFGVAREVATQIKRGSFDQRLMAQAIGRSTTGTATAALGGLLMANGRMTLKAPNGKKDRALWDAQGKQPNSMYVGGHVTKNPNGTWNYQGGHWITLNPFGAIGITLGIGGAYEQARTDAKGDPVKQVTQTLASGARLLMDQPYFKGVSGAANALNDPTRYAQTFLDNTIGSVIPTGVQQVARGTDPYQRTYPTNIPDTLKAGIPGQRETLPVKQDLFGNKLPGSGGSIGGDINGILNPFYPQAARNQNDAVTSELQRLYNQLGSSTSPNIALPGKNLTINGQKVTMTPQQLSQYIAGSGPVIHTAIANLMNNPQYQQLGDEQKANAINTVITAAHTAQKVDQFGSNPKSLTAADRTALSNPGDLGKVINTKGSAGNPSQTYQQKLLKYQQQKMAGQLTSVQDYKAQQSLAKEAITSNFNSDTTSLYGMSKAKIASYLNSQNPQAAAQTYSQLQQLDSQLYNAGIIKKPKFSNGLASSSGSGTRRTSSGTRVAKAKKLTLPKVKGVSTSTKLAGVYKPKSFKTPKVKAPKFASSKRAKYPSFAVKTPKLTRKALA